MIDLHRLHEIVEVVRAKDRSHPRDRGRQIRRPWELLNSGVLAAADDEDNDPPPLVVLEFQLHALMLTRRRRLRAKKPRAVLRGRSMRSSRMEVT